MLHNGPKPGAGQMLSRATLASRSSGDLAGHDNTASVAAAREDSSCLRCRPLQRPRRPPRARVLPCSRMQPSKPLCIARPVRARHGRSRAMQASCGDVLQGTRGRAMICKACGSQADS